MDVRHKVCYIYYKNADFESILLQKDSLYCCYMCANFSSTWKTISSFSCILSSLLWNNFFWMTLYHDQKSFTLFLAHFHTLKATHFGSHAAQYLYSILVYMNKMYGALLNGLLNGIVKKIIKNRWKKCQNELQRRPTRWLPDISMDRQTLQLHQFHSFAFTIIKRHFILFSDHFGQKYILKQSLKLAEQSCKRYFVLLNSYCICLVFAQKRQQK